MLSLIVIVVYDIKVSGVTVFLGHFCQADYLDSTHSSTAFEITNIRYLSCIIFITLTRSERPVRWITESRHCDDCMDAGGRATQEQLPSDAKQSIFMH